ncbi:MAG TPA: gamma-glutamylcyclotransferase family protein [Acidobacteriota bacterium]|nr:gamma-glutamylcyclotransferase family protein [Acidobacteriota bacterium]
MNLFVYGELCCAETIVGLLGRMPICVPAVMRGYQREISQATGYYEARPAAGQQIVGLLFGEVTAAETERLDEFEDVANGLYRRRECQVQLVGTGRREVAAQAYFAPIPRAS